jgi:hypothetical protein
LFHKSVSGTGEAITMKADPRSDDAAEIIRGLTGLPGSVSVQVIAKKFPRRGPAEAGTGYLQEEQSFDPAHLPDRLPIPDGMDEIIITLQGVLNDKNSTLALLAQINSLLGHVQASAAWDSRTFFQNAMGCQHTYQVTVFSDTFGVVPSA